MPFQPLIVVILLVFLTVLSLALFLWSLLAMGRERAQAGKQEKRARKQAKKPSGINTGQNRQQKGLSVEKPKIGYLSKKELAAEAESKPKLAKSRVKPTIPPYQELRPKTKNHSASSAKNAKLRIEEMKTSETSKASVASSKSARLSRPRIDDISLKDNKAAKDKSETRAIEPKVETAGSEAKQDKAKTKDQYRGLNASKKAKKEDLDPFDSFVEASKKLG